MGKKRGPVHVLDSRAVRYMFASAGGGRNTPMHRHYSLRSKRWVKWGISLLLFAAGCAVPPAMAQVPVTAPPVPAGQARIWFYRSWEPSESLNLANINVNGSYFGSVANGGAFYRDVSPGHYHIAPQSYGQDFNQDRDVDLAS